MRGLNLSKFKKMAEDKNSAVLIHKDGHKLVIAKMSLPHAQRKQLEALETHEGYDEGGQVQSDNSGFTPTGQEAQFQNQDQSPITDQNIKQLNDINSGERTPANSVELEMPTSHSGYLGDNGRNVMDFSLQNKPPTNNDKTVLTPDSSLNDVQNQLDYLKKNAPKDTTPMKKPVTSLNDVQDQLKYLQDNVPSASKAAQPSQVQGAPGTNPTGAGGSYGLGGNKMTYPTPNLPAPQPQQPTQQELITKLNQRGEALQKAFAENQIDPNRFLANSGLGSWLGVLVSAIGQGIGAGQVTSNVALDQINKNIDSQIDIDKNDRSHIMNLWNMNQKALGNALAADLQTKNQAMEAAKFQLLKSANESGNALAIQKAAEIAQKIKFANQDRDKQTAALNGTSDNPDPAVLLPHLVKNHADIPKVAAQMDAAKNTVRGAPGIFEAFDNAAKEARAMTGGLHVHQAIPGMLSPSQKSFHTLLGPTIIDLEGANRQSLQESLEKNLTPQAWDDDKTVEIKREALAHYMRSKSSSSLAKGYNIDFSKFPLTDTSKIGLPGGPGAPVPQIRSDQDYELVRKKGDSKVYRQPIRKD